MWHAAPLHTVEKFKDLAKKAKEEHAAKYPDYNYQPRKPSEKKRRMTKKKPATPQGTPANIAQQSFPVFPEQPLLDRATEKLIATHEKTFARIRAAEIAAFWVKEAAVTARRPGDLDLSDDPTLIGSQPVQPDYPQLFAGLNNSMDIPQMTEWDNECYEFDAGGFDKDIRDILFPDGDLS